MFLPSLNLVELAFNSARCLPERMQGLDLVATRSVREIEPLQLIDARQRVLGEDEDIHVVTMQQAIHQCGMAQRVERAIPTQPILT